MNILSKYNRFNAWFLSLVFISACLINSLSVPVIFSVMGSTHKLSYQLADNSVNIILHHDEEHDYNSLKPNISDNDHHDHQIFLPILDTQLHKPVNQQMFKGFVNLIQYDNFLVSAFENNAINLKKERGPPYPDIIPNNSKLNTLKTIILLI